ncbi:hypothetical protein V7S43_001926 [Phytophthora oleae]|uniref:Crinkler effector protein N-terminal domain-containing protein n=1 Tax=Phytophthora oleae TaxID=2107226 RepID=A0ABD3G250_9STRA
MGEVTLFCALVGAQEGVLSVKIDANKSVHDLKEKIKAVKPNDLKGVDADKLELFLAKTKGGAWLDGAGVAAVTTVTVDVAGVVPVLLAKDGNRHIFVKMKPTLWIKNAKYFGESFLPGEDQVHVLVVVPKPIEEFEQNKRLRVEVEVLDDVPQIDIDSDEKYVTLPAAFVKKCGLVSNGDLMMYCRPQVHELWKFLREKVVVQNSRGFIVGPPGTGKSACTLSFAASLDREQWNVVWIHLTRTWKACVAMGTKQYWGIRNREPFDLPRIAGKRLFLCVDGYKYTDADNAFLGDILVELQETDRLVICSSMTTLGKRDKQDDIHAKLEFFFMYSWTQDEYLEAIENEAFYKTVEAKFDATSVSEVSDEGNKEEELCEGDKKKRACQLKFYYAGGSCRFMFQFTTEEVKGILIEGVESALNKTELVTYCGGAFHTAAINRLYGMQNDGTKSGRFPVSSYAASLFAHECGTDVIADLARRLNASNNPSVDGHLFEWLFFASVQQREVKLFSDQGFEEILPQSSVYHFDPKKRFQKFSDGDIKADQHWLQPVAWNQGGYDAVYFDTKAGEVTFVQVTRSDKHDFKRDYFHEVLLKLRQAGMKILKVVVYFVVKSSQYMKFKLNHIDGRGLLQHFDLSWTRPEENCVKVRAFEAAPRLI